MLHAPAPRNEATAQAGVRLGQLEARPSAAVLKILREENLSGTRAWWLCQTGCITCCWSSEGLWRKCVQTATMLAPCSRRQYGGRHLGAQSRQAKALGGARRCPDEEAGPQVEREARHQAAAGHQRHRRQRPAHAGPLQPRWARRRCQRDEFCTRCVGGEPGGTTRRPRHGDDRQAPRCFPKAMSLNVFAVTKPNAARRRVAAGVVARCPASDKGFESTCVAPTTTARAAAAHLFAACLLLLRAPHKDNIFFTGIIPARGAA